MKTDRQEILSMLTIWILKEFSIILFALAAVDAVAKVSMVLRSSDCEICCDTSSDDFRRDDFGCSLAFGSLQTFPPPNTTFM